MILTGLLPWVSDSGLRAEKQNFKNVLEWNNNIPSVYNIEVSSKCPTRG